MRKNVFVRIAMMLVAVPVLVGCDEGDISETAVMDRADSRSAHLAASLSGVDTWSAGYSVALAGFANGSDYALISKDVGTGHGEDGTAYDVTLSGIPAGVTTVELCVINRLRQRVAQICTVDLPAAAGSGAVVELPEGFYDCSIAAAVQTSIFDPTCAQCHGGAGNAAAGLYLTGGRSRESLVDVPSVKIDGAVRLVPGHSNGSLLYLILSTSESASWSYDHSVEVVDPVKLDLIKDWIDGGAK